MIFRKLSIISILSIVVGCSQETTIIPSHSEAKQHKATAAITPNYQSENPDADPGNFAKSYVKPISINGAITYHSIYGGFDLNFGASFPYPTVVNAYENYSKYTPSIGSVLASPNPLYEFKMGPDGSAFTAVFLTIVAPLPVNGHTALNNYYKAFDDFITQKTDPQTGLPKQPTLPDFSTYANAVSYNPATNGMITIKGRFAKDNTSPTNISIIDMTPFPYIEPL